MGLPGQVGTSLFILAHTFCGQLGKTGHAPNSLSDFTNPETESLVCISRCEKSQTRLKKKQTENPGKDSDIDVVNPASDMGANWEATDKKRITGIPSITRPSPGTQTPAEQVGARLQHHCQ